MRPRSEARDSFVARWELPPFFRPPSAGDSTNHHLPRNPSRRTRARATAYRRRAHHPSLCVGSRMPVSIIAPDVIDIPPTMAEATRPISCFTFASVRKQNLHCCEACTQIVLERAARSAATSAARTGAPESRRARARIAFRQCVARQDPPGSSRLLKGRTVATAQRGCVCPERASAALECLAAQRHRLVALAQRLRKSRGKAWLCVRRGACVGCK